MQAISSPHRRAWRFYFLFSAAAFLACSGGGCLSSCLDPLPYGHYQGERLESVAAVKLTSSGFTTLNAEAPKLLERIAPGGQLTVPLKCAINTTKVANLVSISLAIADQGAAGCTQESCGQLDGKCDARDMPVNIPITFNGMKLSPKAPDQIEISLDLTFSTGKILISTVDRNSLLCLFKPAKCGIDFDSSRAAPNNNELTAGIKFTVDTRWGKLLKMEVGSLGGTKVCGTSGANPKPACLDSADLVITSESSCDTCTVADWDPVKMLLMDQVAKSLQGAVQDALDDMNCRACSNTGACPQNGTITSQCDAFTDAGLVTTADGGVNGHCLDTMTKACVPAIFGLEGRADVSKLTDLLPATPIDLSFAAGGGSKADTTGFTQGFVGGVQPADVSTCVKTLTPPVYPVLPLPSLDPQAPGPYDIGVSLSQQLLNRGLFQAQQAGLFCLSVGHDRVAQLETSVLATFLGSLNKLSDDGPTNGPVHVVVRPTHPPTMTVGQGTFDAMGKIDKPLLTLSWNDVEVDVYAIVYERWVRLFTMSADITLPFGLQIENCTRVTPVLGDLKNAITDVRALNSEILAEDVTSLQGLVPSLITLVEPMLAAGLPGFDIPEIEGYQLHLLSAKGVEPIANTTEYQHLGLYAQLKKPMDVCNAPPPSMLLPANAAQRDGPRLKLHVGAAWPTKSFSVRIDKGFWSTFQKPAADGTVTLEHPKLLLGLGHTVEVRERDDRTPLSVSTSSTLTLRPDNSHQKQQR